MVAGSREFVAGMTRFPGFGPCVLFGLGGIFTEALKDTAFRSAPLSATEAEEMLPTIRAKTLLGAYRGLPAVDLPALAGILQTVGFIALLHPEIAEIDLNPVIIAGSRPVVADALLSYRLTAQVVPAQSPQSAEENFFPPRKGYRSPAGA